MIFIKENIDLNFKFYEFLKAFIVLKIEYDRKTLIKPTFYRSNTRKHISKNELDIHVPEVFKIRNLSRCIY